MTSLHVDARIAHLIAAGKLSHYRARMAGDTPAPWRPGHSYAVLPHGLPALCRVIVDDVQVIAAGDHTQPHELQTEGHRSRADMARAWLGRSRIREATDDDVLRIFDRHHAHRPAWRATIKLDTSHRPRLLHARHIGAYTTEPAEAAADEPEAVPEFVDDRELWFAEERATAGVGEIERRTRAELTDLDDRLERAIAKADARQIPANARDDIRQIRYLMNRLEHTLGRTA